MARKIAKQIMIDETGLKGKYDFELKYDLMNPESVKAAIKEQFGLELSSAKRQVEILVVEKNPAN